MLRPEYVVKNNIEISGLFAVQPVVADCSLQCVVFLSQNSYHNTTMATSAKSDYPINTYVQHCYIYMAYSHVAPSNNNNITSRNPFTNGFIIFVIDSQWPRLHSSKS